MIIVRPERPDDFASVRKINEEAFGQPNEADLVDALRRHVSPYISLVAQSDQRLVGHIFFSPVAIQAEEADFPALGLAPMAVLPEFQRQGIGSQLVREGLKECLHTGHSVVVVLGHPSYYPRFGFAPAKPQGILCQYPVPDDVFMVAELTPGALGGRRGTVRYHADFDAV
jgi:putative acetyltransferase